jgi:hypothetical protein
MKRLAFLVVFAAVAAGGIYFASHRAASTSHATVTTLLPSSTVGFAHVPDFQRTRDEWRGSDIYKLYHEQAVQDFLKPLSNVPHGGATSDTLSDLERLDPKDAFIAVTAIENNNPHFVGGFRFRGSQANAEAIVAKWRSRLVHDDSAHETVDYATHKIDIVGAAPNQIATVYDGDWLFASNDLAELKTVLDRADGRAKDPKLTMDADETFRAAVAHMPSSYGLLFYFQPNKLSAGISSIPNTADSSISGDARAALEQIRSVYGAAKFEKGKIRDVLFVGAPKMPIGPELTRNSLKLGTADTFLYVGALLNPDRLAGIGQAGNTMPLGGWLQKVFDVVAHSGVTADEWKAAFDLEGGALAEWPQTAHLPSIVAVLPVKDPSRAFKIADALTKAIDEDAAWRKTEKNGVRYYYAPSPVALISITPTIAVSDRQLIIGLDSVSVEAAMTRAMPNAPSAPSLADSSTYKSAAHSVFNPTTGFVYVDTALLYSRLDAALRPMLLMSAAFMPAMSDYVDVTKLPPTETVTRHLSPIVLSQRYEQDGYVTESVGPISLDLGLALPAIGWWLSHGHDL